MPKADQHTYRDPSLGIDRIVLVLRGDGDEAVTVTIDRVRRTVTRVSSEGIEVDGPFSADELAGQMKAFDVFS